MDSGSDIHITWCSTIFAKANTTIPPIPRSRSQRLARADIPSCCLLVCRRTEPHWRRAGCLYVGWRPAPSPGDPAGPVAGSLTAPGEVLQSSLTAPGARRPLPDDLWPRPVGQPLSTPPLWYMLRTRRYQTAWGGGDLGEKGNMGEGGVTCSVSAERRGSENCLMGANF